MENKGFLAPVENTLAHDVEASFSRDAFHLRLITPEDNEALAAIIVAVLASFGCTGDGYACADPETQAMFQAYQVQGAAYWVVVHTETGAVYGGGGYGPLKNVDLTCGVCEIQKFYFLPALRGLGFGRLVLEHCLTAYIADGYALAYLETIPEMTAARSLYESLGFARRNIPLGGTGHSGCSVWMEKPLV
jgi:putative acetyltransferase